MKGVFIIMMKITKIGQSKPDPFNNNSKSSRHDKQPIHIIIHNHHHTFGQQQQQMQKINFNLTDQPISNKTKKNCAFFHMKSRFCCWSTIFFVAPFFFWWQNWFRLFLSSFESSAECSDDTSLVDFHPSLSWLTTK